MSNQQNQSRLLMTHTLLDSWNYLYKTNEKQYYLAYENFINTLNRIDVEPTKAMLAGKEFERLVSDVMRRKAINHVWFNGATEIADIIGTGVWEQAKMMKDITVNGVDYLLCGVIDWFGGGYIYDVKFIENLCDYSVGYYYNNTHHRMYFELIHGADTFVYLISNGHKVYREEYKRDECRPISEAIAEFERWLKQSNLWDIYAEKWQIT